MADTVKVLSPLAIAAYNRRPLTGIARYFAILREFFEYRRLSNGHGETISLRDFWPFLIDRDRQAGSVDQYFYQDIWCIEHVTKHRPAVHVDVGSTLLAMAALSRTVPLVYVDLRPLTVSLPGLTFQQGNVTALPFADGSIESLSSLSVVEHIGLGRYGDPLDPEGTDKACRELQRVLRPGGHLYVAVPVAGKSAVHFNAHRVFAPEDFLAKFRLPLVEETYACVDGLKSRTNYEAAGMPYAFGCFCFS
jgi:SAM-dependent methyltransferase